MSAHPEWLAPLFEAIDHKNMDRFVGFLAEDVIFTFGNADPTHGRAAVGAAVQGFFDSVAALSHTVQDAGQVGEFVFCRGTATYTRHDGSQLTVPFANVFRMQQRSIRDYQIYVDTSQLYR